MPPVAPGRMWCAASPRGIRRSPVCAVRHGPAVSGAAGGKARPGRGPSGPGGVARVSILQGVAGSPPDYRKG